MAIDFIRSQSSTSYPIQFQLVLSIDHTTPATGKSPTVTRSKNGGSFNSASGAVSEIANGWYSLAGNATDRDTLGELALHITATGCDNLDIKGMVITSDMFAASLGLSFPTNFASMLINSSGQVQPDTVLLTGTASAGGTNTITLAGGSTTDNLYKYAIVEITGGTGAGQSRLIINYVGSTKVATVNKDWTTAPDATSIFRLIAWGTPTVVHSGIAQAGAASSITLQSIASATDNIYNGQLITLFSGTGAFQSRIITAYNGTTKVATVDRAWTTNPDSTSVYEVGSVGPGYSDVFYWNGHAVATDTVNGVPKVDLADILGTAVSTPATAGILDVNVKNIKNAATAGAAGYAGVDWAAINAPTTTVDLSGTTIKNVDNAIAHVTTVDGNVAGNVTGSVGSVLGNVGGNVLGSVNSVVSTVSATLVGILSTALSETTLGNLAAAFKKFFDIGSPVLTTASVNQTGDVYGNLFSDAGTAQSGSTTNIRLRSGAPSTNLTGQTVFIVSGTGAKQSSPISAYNTTTKDATTTWSTVPDATSVYVIIAAQGGSGGGGGSDPLVNPPSHYSPGQIGYNLDYQLSLLRAALSAASVTLLSPVVGMQIIPLITNRDYKHALGNPINFTATGLAFNLTDPGVSLKMNVEVGGTPVPITGTVTSATEGYFDIDHASTAGWLAADAPRTLFATEIIVVKGTDEVSLVKWQMPVEPGVGS